MFRRIALALVLGLAWPFLALETAMGAEQLPPASGWIPQDTIVFVELRQPQALLDLAFDPGVVEAVTSLPAYQAWTLQPGYQEFVNFIQHLETVLATDWQTGVRTLLGGGVTLAVRGNDAMLIVDSKDEQMLQQLHGVFLGIARVQDAELGQPGRVVSQEYRGVTGWAFSEEEAHAIVGNRLLLAKGPAALKAALDVRAQPEGGSLASLSTYQAAKQAAGPDAVATVFVNLAIVKQIPAVQRALDPGQNPMVSLLFGGMQEALRGSQWSVIAVDVNEDTLTAKVMADGKVTGQSGSASFAYPSQPDEGVLPNLSVPRRIAAFSFYRDLHAFYAAKDELFPARTSGLIFFENMMGIYFTGRDLSDEVMAEIRPEIRLVVAEQEYDPSIGTPRVQIPAFALILRLRNPDKFAQVMEEAWQKAIGMVSFTSGQRAAPGLIIDRPSYDGVKYTVAYYSSAEEEDKTAAHQRYNFRPALARSGDYLILSSTDGLARDLMDALKRESAEPVKPLAQVHTLVELDAVQLASILRANRENLVRQNMVNDGNTREQAEIQMDSVMTALEYLGQAKLEGQIRDGRAHAVLELRPCLPESGSVWSRSRSQSGTAGGRGTLGER